MPSVYLILHDIRSVHNVGAMFRTADAAGVTKIYCTGYTPLPIDRFGRDRNDLAKAALGAEKTVPWEYKDNVEELLTALKNDGVTIVSLEQTHDSIDYKTYVPTGDCALVVGNERDGVPETTLALSDVKIVIPMKGIKESLNVSTALGIALFRILDL